MTRLELLLGLNDDIILENTIPSTENRNKKLEESDTANVEEQLKINMDVSNNTNMKLYEESDMKLAYKCNQCDFKAPYKFIMKKHIRVNHAATSDKQRNKVINIILLMGNLQLF